MKSLFLPAAGIEYPAMIEISYVRKMKADFPPITTSDLAVDVVKACFKPRQLDYKEHVWLLCLNSPHHLLSASCISQGTLDQSLICVREIIQTAMLVHAYAVIIIHNHPSGNLTVSRSDRIISQKIVSACSLHELTVLDHIILTSEGHFSMAEEGILPSANLHLLFNEKI